MAFNKSSNGYVLFYTVLLTVVCGSLLAVAALGLKKQINDNEELERQKSILSTFMEIPTDRQKVVDTYNDLVTDFVINAKGEKLKGEGGELVKAKDIEVNKEYKQKKQLPSLVFQF